MSILKQFGAALLLAAISLPLWAAPSSTATGGEITFKSQAVEAKSIAVRLYNLDKEYTQVQIQGLEGTVYYEKNIKDHNGFSMVLDLDQLPEGTYILSVKRKDGTKNQVVRIKDDGLMLSQVVEK